MGCPGEGAEWGPAGRQERGSGSRGPHSRSWGWLGEAVHTDHRAAPSLSPLAPAPAAGPRSQDVLVAPGGHCPDAQTMGRRVTSAAGSGAGLSPQTEPLPWGFGASCRSQAAEGGFLWMP